MLLNSDLSSLASMSAIAIDAYMYYKSTQKDHDLVGKFSEEVDKISKSRLSSPEELVLAEIAWPNHEDWVGKKREDIYLQANLLAKDLRYFADLSEERQKELRRVCIEISAISRNIVQRHYLEATA